MLFHQYPHLRVLCFLLLILPLRGQSVFTINLGYGYQIPLHDLKDRFGNGFTVEGMMDYITPKGWLAGPEGNYFFAEQVHEDVLKNLRDAQGDIIAANGTIADIRLRQRGWMAGIHAGKLFRFYPDLFQGIRLTVGGGYLQHWIRILDNSQAVAQVLPPYNTGYDRKTGGAYVRSGVAYEHIDKHRRLNFILGVQYIHGFTSGLRDYDFATMSSLKDKRSDGLLSFTASLMLPFYIANKQADTLEY